MKKTMIFCCMGLLTGLGTMAQTVNEKSIKTPNSNFELITSVGTQIGNNDAVINFGKEDKSTPQISESVIKDEKGGEIVFHSMNEALQFMGQDGYPQINSVMYTIDKNPSTQYLLQKKMENKMKFKIGDGVTVTSGPMKKIYGTVIFFDKKSGKYLIRFGSAQQLYYTEDQIEIWKK